MVTPEPIAERETLDMPTVFKALGISRPYGYQLARKDALPIPIIRIGTRMVVSKRALDELLNKTKPVPPEESRVA